MAPASWSQPSMVSSSPKSRSLPMLTYPQHDPDHDDHRNREDHQQQDDRTGSDMDESCHGCEDEPADDRCDEDDARDDVQVPRRLRCLSGSVGRVICLCWWLGWILPCLRRRPCRIQRLPVGLPLGCHRLRTARRHGRCLWSGRWSGRGCRQRAHRRPGRGSWCLDASLRCWLSWPNLTVGVRVRLSFCLHSLRPFPEVGEREDRNCVPFRLLNMQRTRLGCGLHEDIASCASDRLHRYQTSALCQIDEVCAGQTPSSVRVRGNPDERDPRSDGQKRSRGFPPQRFGCHPLQLCWHVRLAVRVSRSRLKARGILLWLSTSDDEPTAFIVSTAHVICGRFFNRSRRGL